jgi:predicted PurR-regulated permease PerM
VTGTTSAPAALVDIRKVSSSAALKVAAVVFGLAVALRFLWIAHPVLIVAFLGILIGLALSRAADHLEKIRLPRALSVPLVLLIVIGILVASGIAMAPMVRDQTQDLAEQLPKAIDRIESFIKRSPLPLLDEPGTSQPAESSPEAPSAETPPSGAPDEGASQETEAAASRQPDDGAAGTGQGAAQGSPGGLKAQLGKELRGATRLLFPVLSTTFGAIAGLLLVIFIAVYIAIAPDVYRKGVLHLVPHQSRDRAEEVLSSIGDTLRQWLLARVIAMVLVGIITGTGLALLQVRGAAALGLFAGLMEFVPFFGPIVSAIPGIGIALVDSPEKALWVAVFYVVVQQIESNLITPLLLKSRLDIPPVLTLLAVSALGLVFGVIGMLAAEPLLAAALVATKMLYVRDVVGDDVKIGKKE